MAFHVHKALGYALDVSARISDVHTDRSYLQEYKNYTGRGTSGHYSGFGDVFRSGPSEQHGGGGSSGVWSGAPMGGPPGSLGGPQGGGPSPYGGGGSFQQANQMASRLQQMAMEENGGRGSRSLEYQNGYPEEDEYSGPPGGMKRQMHSQGGSRGKKNRGGWGGR